MCKKSESIKNLAMALVKFNGEVSKISKNAENPFFKNNYASLDNIIDEVRPVLQRHGLSVLQMPGGDGENVIMTTMILHESGEWIESDPLKMKPVKNDPQAVGSCVTYARRYSLAAILSLNTGEDDDGNLATGPQQQKSSQQNQTPPKTTTPPPSGNYITEGQVKMLYAKWKQSSLSNQSLPVVCELMSAHLTKTITDFKEVEKSDINSVIKWLETAA